ncbi:MAG: cation:proton antiporter [Nitrospinae bacterium]|jgi:Kef-type K+ transport system membrane component KefB|nr:cation:proton antiporter [Nitrospinota bacterium]MDA1108576.1 cation:proton antiporter [Nitrospinota bacterium]
MDPVFKHLLILMVVVWTVAVVLRRIGLPTIFGELVAGVTLGPAVLGWVQPNEIIEVLAQMGIFFLMLHAGVTTEPREFFKAVKSSIGVAVVGALVPFAVSFSVARAFGLSIEPAVFVGLTMTATAVVVTLKIFQDLNLHKTRLSRLVVAVSVVDAMLTLLIFSIVISIFNGKSINAEDILIIVAKVVGFFGLVIVTGKWFYPFFKHPFRHREGKGFTFVLILGLTFGLLAEAIGLHMILGAYMAGLFFREEVAHKILIEKVEDRLYGIAYSFLGPIFFISLGFHVTFDALQGQGLGFVLALTSACAVGQIVSAGGMARREGFSWLESLTVGVGMMGRAEMAFVLAALGLSMNAISEDVFSILIFVTFLMNMLAIIGLKVCAIYLKKEGLAGDDKILEGIG